MDPYERIIFENWPRAIAFSETSFSSILHETGVWDEKLYWEVDQAFFVLGKRHQGVLHDRDLVEAISHIFLYVSGRLNYHRMASDMSEIKGFNDEMCFQWAERLEGAFRVALYGENLGNDAFELENPLM